MIHLHASGGKVQSQRIPNINLLHCNFNIDMGQVSEEKK